MGGAACLIIINGGRAYAAAEELAERYNSVDTYYLQSAINASCSVVPYASLYLRSKQSYLSNELMQPIIDLHDRIINELPVVSKQDAQLLVDELAKELYSACYKIANDLEE